MFLCAAIVLPAAGYTQEQLPDTINAKDLADVVESASRRSEKILQAPVSIEKLALEDIKRSAQPSFFDVIEQLI